MTTETPISSTHSMSKKQQTKQAHCEELVRRLGEGHYTFRGKYLNHDTYLTFIHSDCQHSFSATLGQFKTGKRCPYCEN